MNNFFSTNLKFLRQKNGYTQEQLATKIKKDYSTIGKWENNTRSPIVEDIILLSEILNMPLPDLLIKDLRIEVDNFSEIIKIDTDTQVSLHENIEPLEKNTIDSTYNHLASNLSFLRLKSNLTQTELGKEVGVDGSTISRWEKNDMCPTSVAIINLCKFFNISTDEILLTKMLSDKIMIPNNATTFKTTKLTNDIFIVKNGKIDITAKEAIKIMRKFNDYLINEIQNEK